MNDIAVEKHLRKLHRLLIGPVVKAGLHPEDFERWIIVPHSMLHMVPWPALLSKNNRHLIEEVALTQAPSASVWFKLQARTALPARTFIGMANPTLPNAILAKLPGAELEVEAIKKKLERSGLDCSVRKQDGAAETALR